MSQQLATYASSKGGGATYVITKGDDGVTYCNCTGWKMRKNCKHLLDFTINKAASALQVFSQEQIESNEYQKETVEQLNGDQQVADAVQIAINMMRG